MISVLSCDALAFEKCGDATELRLKKLFSSADKKDQLKLLVRCAHDKKICIISKKSNPPGYAALGFNDSQDKALKALREGVIASFVSTTNKDLGDICLFSTYSGGSSAAWLVTAWTVNKGNIELLNTRNISINGEEFAPAYLVNQLEQSVEKVFRPQKAAE